MKGASASSARRLLLVDDEERILSALHRSLRREGYTIFMAQTVERALEILDRETVDLILSDHVMPGMTGIEFLAEARRRQPRAVRILISGWSQTVSRRDLKKLGVEHLVSKPWDDAELKGLLRRALG